MSTQVFLPTPASVAITAIKMHTLTVARTPATPTAVMPVGQVWRFYYYAGSARIAVREKAAGVNNLYFLLSDHLGGASKTISATGEIVAELRYTAFGETWYGNGNTPTDLKYTGQREFAELGLYFYQSRFYDAMAGRFVSADTIVPNPVSSLAWDRYSYVQNNPIINIDPSGHMITNGCDYEGCSGDPNVVVINPPNPYIQTEVAISNDNSKDISNSNDQTNVDVTPPFDATLGGNNPVAKAESKPENKRPSWATLIAIGIPLTLAIALAESGLTIAEIEIAAATLAAPELAILTIPLELVLVGSSAALLDLDIAYWVYTYRVAFTPKSEPVKFEFLPPWGLDKKIE